MHKHYCPGCAGTILGSSYVALDGTLWCQACYRSAAQEVHQNYAQEEQAAIVDHHAQVLDVLDQRAEALP